MDTELEILIKIKKLTDKWKGKEPVKYSSEYWRYRADQLYYLSLKRQLKPTKKE